VTRRKIEKVNSSLLPPLPSYNTYMFLAVSISLPPLPPIPYNMYKYVPGRGHFALLLEDT
jgi:hypothetical protein